jgi:hypothetical protein
MPSTDIDITFFHKMKTQGITSEVLPWRFGKISIGTFGKIWIGKL